MRAPYHQDDILTLHHGDALTVAKTLPDASVQTIVTSPPYFGLRDYGEDGQIGAEESVAEYVEALRCLFSELRRVVADDGTLWLNLGDSYVGARGGPQGESGEMAGRAVADHRQGTRTRTVENVPPKNLIGVPWRVAFALQADGWILRSDIIWAKPNPMPESVTDRPTKSHEHLFLLSKSPQYYYNADAIAEPIVKGDAGSRFDTGKTATHQLGRAQVGPRFGGTKYGESESESESESDRTKSGNVYTPPEDGLRNARDVWTIPTTPFSGAHFAVFPAALVRPCILAGSKRGDTILDPFSGSGTTGKVALDHGRKYVGIDLNSAYLDLSLRTRFAQPPLNVFGGAA